MVGMNEAPKSKKIFRKLGFRSRNDPDELAREKFRRKTLKSILLASIIAIFFEWMTSLAIIIAENEKLNSPLDSFIYLWHRWQVADTGDLGGLLSMTGVMATLVVAVVFTGRLEKSTNPLTRAGVEWLHIITYLAGLMVGSYSISLFFSTVASGDWGRGDLYILIIGLGVIVMGVISNFSEFQLDADDDALRRHLVDADKSCRNAHRFHSLAVAGAFRGRFGITWCIFYFVWGYSIFPVVTFWIDLAWGIAVSVVVLVVQMLWLMFVLSDMKDHPYWSRRSMVINKVTLFIVGVGVVFASLVPLASVPEVLGNVYFLLYALIYSLGVIWGAYWFSFHWTLTRVAVHDRWQKRYSESTERLKREILKNTVIRGDSVPKNKSTYNKNAAINRPDSSAWRRGRLHGSRH